MSDKQSRSDSFNFIPGFLKMRRNQYLITFGFMVFFALLGLLVSFGYKFQYEAESVLITNLELVEDTNITEIMVDSQLELVRQLMYHPDITDMVLSVEKEAGNPITLDQLKSMSVVERRLNSTIFKIRDYDPSIAARIANSWAKAAFERLSTAYEHALRVSEAKWMLTTIEDCVTDEKLFEVPFCKNLTPEKVTLYTEAAQETILKESASSLGLTKDIQISQYQLASVPTEPIQGNQASLIIVGALVGLVLSLILFELPFFKQFAEVE